jgi:hypothetical protein
MYAKLEDENATPLFQVTRGKNCRMYPYLWSQECEDIFGQLGNPQQNPFKCQSQGPVDPGQSYTGYPISFKYTLAGNPKNAEKPADDYPEMIGEGSNQRIQVTESKPESKEEIIEGFSKKNPMYWLMRWKRGY